MAADPSKPKDLWNAAFEEAKALQAYNTSPVEAVIRNVSYHLRQHYSQDDYSKLHFLEMGSGAGPNLTWLAEKGINVSGVDISPVALNLCRNTLERRGFGSKLKSLVEASVGNVPFESGSFDGIIEACVFQHLNKTERQNAFGEVKRLLKPGGVFVGYMLDRGHTVYQERKGDELKDDPGTLVLQEGKSNVYLTNLGTSHFYSKEEICELLDGFKIVDPLLTTYYIPTFEAKKRGYDQYLQSMWTVYAVK